MRAGSAIVKSRWGIGRVANPMSMDGELFNVTIGLCAIAYSFVPPHRVRHYRPGVALALRAVGLVLVLISGTSVLLERR